MFQSFGRRNFADFIATSAKEEGKQHVRDQENIALLNEEAALENKLIAQSFNSFFYAVNSKRQPS